MMKHLLFCLLALIISFSCYALGPITGPSALCAGSTDTLTDATAGGTWSSSVPGVAAVGSGTGLVTGIAPGAATITYTLGASSVTYMITVNALPTIFPITGGGVFCLGYGDRLGLSGSATGINYQLYFSGAPSGSMLAGTGSPIDMGWHSAYGDYVVTATNSTTGCYDTMGYVNISISTPINPVLIPIVSVSSSAGDTVCAGTSVIFDALPVNGGTAPLYQWAVNGVVVGSGGPTYTYVPANGDIVTSVLTSNAMCAIPDTAVNDIVITVVAPTAPVVAISAIPGTNITPGETVTFTAIVTGGGTGLTYHWSVNGVPAAGATSSTFITSGLYNGDSVTCVVISTGLCGPLSGSNFVTIHISAGVNNVLRGNAEFQLFPNPSLNKLTLKADQATYCPVIINNEVGQTLIEDKMEGLEKNIDISVLPPGLYLITLKGDGVNKVMRFVKM